MKENPNRKKNVVFIRAFLSALMPVSNGTWVKRLETSIVIIVLFFWNFPCIINFFNKVTKIFYDKNFCEIDFTWLSKYADIPFPCDSSSRKLLDVQSYLDYELLVTDKNGHLLSFLVSVSWLFSLGVRLQSQVLGISLPLLFHFY